MNLRMLDDIVKNIHLKTTYKEYTERNITIEQLSKDDFVCDLKENKMVCLKDTEEYLCFDNKCYEIKHMQKEMSVEQKIDFINKFLFASGFFAFFAKIIGVL